ncbi:MAG: IS66 family transposase [Roseateles sp.]|uniref:IS66 family transposase n=1 Tax=Roseateles sp. TaxID=1971397 RepID=UPI004036984E
MAARSTPSPQPVTKRRTQFRTGFRRLRGELPDAPRVFGDETELQVPKEPGRAAQAKSCMWAQMTEGSGYDGTGPPAVHLCAQPPTQTAMALYAGMREGAVL